MPSVVITGASQGIGRATAIAFSKEPGARLALISRNEALLDETADLCRKNGAEADVYVCDVTDAEAVARTARAVTSATGTPDVLVNNAGLFEAGDIRSTALEQFRDQLEVNLTSAFVVTKAFLDDMIGRGKGHLFYLCSVASIRGYAGGAAYCASKHGLLGLARVVREEMKEYGIRVTAVIPGATITASWEGTDLPDDRFMPPEDVAHAIVESYRLSSRSVVEEILIRPQLGDV